MNKDQITLNQLIRIADNATWDQFEAMTDGRLLLRDYAQTILSDEEDVNPLLWLFEMRVGLHFERPMQAVMSCGHFIRMRSAEQWQNCILGKLDPEHPEACFYQHPIPQHTQGVSVSWRPSLPQAAWQQMQQLHQQQPQQGLSQSAGGYGLNTSSSTPVWLGPGQTITSGATPNSGILTGFANALGIKV